MLLNGSPWDIAVIAGTSSRLFLRRKESIFLHLVIIYFKIKRAKGKITLSSLTLI